MYGDIKVTSTKTKTFADYVTRMFIVEKVMLAYLFPILCRVLECNEHKHNLRLPNKDFKVGNIIFI